MINSCVWVSIWNDITRSPEIVRQLRDSVSSGDVDAAASALIDILNVEIQNHSEAGPVDEMRFHLGGYRSSGQGRVYGIGIEQRKNEQKYGVFHSFLDPEPERFRFLYNGQFELADMTVKLLADLVEHGIVRVDATGEEFVKYLISRTAAHVLQSTGLPLVGGDVTVKAIDICRSQPLRKPTLAGNWQAPSYGQPAGTCCDITVATGSIGPRPIKR